MPPTTVLSSKGQVIIPKLIRAAHQWESGQKFEAIDTGDGVLLKPARPFPKTNIADVAACLRFNGQAKTVEEMDEAVAWIGVSRWSLTSGSALRLSGMTGYS